MIVNLSIRIMDDDYPLLEKLLNDNVDDWEIIDTYDEDDGQC